jgi:hypothetical protein
MISVVTQNMFSAGKRKVLIKLGDYLLLEDSHDSYIRNQVPFLPKAF